MFICIVHWNNIMTSIPFTPKNIKLVIEGNDIN